MKPTELDLKDAACLHVVNILQHPTSRPTTASTQDTMVNAPRNNLSPLPAGKYSMSTKEPTQRQHQVNNDKCGLQAERIGGLGALRSLQCKKNLSVEK